MITNKKAKVSTKIAGVMKQVGEATIPLYPQTVEDVVKVFKSTPNIALKCLQNGLTIEAQRLLRNQFAVRETKPSKQKLELIAKLKVRGYYRKEYETMNVQAILKDAWNRVPNKK